jgi:hypothetical protein
MLNVSEALQQAEFTTNATGQPVVQLNLTAWEAINAAVQPTHEDESEEDPVMMQLFLDFITTEALKDNALQPYTIAQSEAAHRLIADVIVDDD